MVNLGQHRNGRVVRRQRCLRRKIVERFGGQQEFQFMIPPPPRQTNEAAN